MALFRANTSYVVVTASLLIIVTSYYPHHAKLQTSPNKCYILNVDLKRSFANICLGGKTLEILVYWMEIRVNIGDTGVLDGNKSKFK